MKNCPKSAAGWRLGSLFAALLAGVACSGSALAEKRVFTVLAVEPKGGANLSQEAFPTAKLPDGGGYVMRPADQTGRWEVSAYVWQPAQIVVDEGDEVTLEFVGIHGASHPTRIEGLGLNFTLQRGVARQVSFVASKAGRFRIVCETHHPSMTGEIVVLPKR